MKAHAETGRRNALSKTSNACARALGFKNTHSLFKIMNNILKTFCIGTVFACGISSCSSDIETIGRDGGDEVVLQASADLRATATKWDAGDCIGVYMKTTGTTLSGTSLTGSTANVSYTTTSGNGVFTATSNKLFFPHDGEG